jgi:hypothetical protein
MYTEDLRHKEHFNVKKERISTTGACNEVIDSLWGLLSGTGRFYLGLAEASIEAMRTFNTEIDNKWMGDAFGGHESMENAHERNARIYEQMAESSRRAAESHKQQREDAAERNKKQREEIAISVSENINYEKLAKLVAEEMRKKPL